MFFLDFFSIAHGKVGFFPSPELIQPMNVWQHCALSGDALKCWCFKIQLSIYLGILGRWNPGASYIIIEADSLEEFGSVCFQRGWWGWAPLKDLTCVFMDYFCVLGYHQSYCKTPGLSCVGLFYNKVSKYLVLQSRGCCFTVGPCVFANIWY